MSLSSVLATCTLRQRPSTGLSQGVAYLLPCSGPSWDVRRILLFNCMKERDPAVLLPTLARGLSAKGVHFHHALFVPPDSQYGFLPTSKKPTPSTPDGVSPIGPASATSAGAGGGVASGKVDSAPDPKVVVSAAADKVSEGPDLSWQSHMQQVWESQSLGASASATAVPQLPSSAFLSAAGAKGGEFWCGSGRIVEGADIAALADDSCTAHCS